MPESSSAEQPVAASAPSTSVPSAPTPSTPPGPPKSNLQRTLETIVDLAAIAVAGGLAWVGKVDGNVALLIIALLAGVRVSDLVSARSGGTGGPGGPAAGGVAGAVLALLSHLAPRAHHAAGLTVLGLSLALAGCPLPAPDNCTPFATRCGPTGIPQTCSGTQRWSHAPAARPCAELGSVCCRALSPYGNEIHACVPSSACLPERVDDAGAAEEGGAP